MRKRWFRSRGRIETSPPEYPTLDDVDADRRQFLAKLGGLVGVGALASTLGACGSRAVLATADGGTAVQADGEAVPITNSGGAPMLPARTDAARYPDAGTDSMALAGEPPMPDAGIDSMTLAGDAPPLDARIDMPVLQGGAPMPPAILDSGCAGDDSGSCPNP